MAAHSCGHHLDRSALLLQLCAGVGLRRIEQRRHIGAAAGISLYGGTLLEGSIGTIASAHAFSTLKNMEWGTELFGPLLLTEDIIQQKLKYQNGHLHLPDGPGLGIEVDWDKVKHFQRS